MKIKALLFEISRMVRTTDKEERAFCQYCLTKHI